MAYPNNMLEVPQRPHHAAWWSGSLAEFRETSDSDIVKALNLRLVKLGYTSRPTHPDSWETTVPVLRDAFKGLPDDWRVALEYPLLRLGRRLDVVMISSHAIFAMEFKTKSETFDEAGRRQVEDYALDLHDFHAGSRHHPIVPILVAPNGKPGEPVWPLIWDYVQKPFEASAKSLPFLMKEMAGRIKGRSVNIAGWESAPYRPVPTIIEAATMLYTKHGVADIAAARADTTNLTRTTAVILNAIEQAQRERTHLIVFVTGIPGAGKTLCGLNAVFGAETGAAFLTGNLPLVHVLREALARDAAPNRKALASARQKTKSAVQGLIGFVTDNLDRKEPPYEHVVVFDEAQRAWDAKFGAASKYKLPDSEAGLFLDIMGKHRDFAVIVALVGNGQEINTGEAGLNEWGRALSKRPKWHVRAAPWVLNAEEPRQRLFESAPEGLIVDAALHLDVPVRSVRSAAGAPWVDVLLRGRGRDAMAVAREGVPFYVTRSLATMRRALRARARGNRRAGLVCSTGARRLVADGIWPDFPHLDDKAIVHWFLNRWPDVRASDALERPATEFACQGLELDYVGLCWGGDLLWDGRWDVRNFSGTIWQYPRKQDAIDFCRNTYRVLLTRARYDTIIWVPQGDAADETRAPRLFDQTAAYLIECGAELLVEDSADMKRDEHPQGEMFKPIGIK